MFNIEDLFCNSISIYCITNYNSSKNWIRKNQRGDLASLELESPTYVRRKIWKICVLKVRWTQVDEAWPGWNLSPSRGIENISLSPLECVQVRTHTRKQARNIHACLTFDLSLATPNCHRSANSWSTTQTTNKIIDLYFTYQEYSCSSFTTWATGENVVFNMMVTSLVIEL